jgi:hypothetical protein
MDGWMDEGREGLIYGWMDRRKGWSKDRIERTIKGLVDG